VVPQKNKRRRRENAGSALGNVDSNIDRPSKRYKKDEFVYFGDGAVIGRIVDTGKAFKDGYVHPVEGKAKSGKTYTRDIMCLDQDDEGVHCPGCQDDLDRRYKFWTRFIVRDAEKVNAKGKSIGYEDRVMLLSSTSKRLLTAINKKNKKYDLAMHDIEIERSGKDFDTQYEVEVLDTDDPTELSKADKNLVENSEIEIKKYTKIPEFDEFYESDNNDDDDEDVGEKSKRRGSSFGSRKKKAVRDDDEDEDDEDEDDDEPAPRRKKSKSSGLGSIKTKSSSSKQRRRR
jgi:hypothetical protein